MHLSTVNPSKLAVHLVILPRWFALPVVVLAVALGAIIAGAPLVPVVVSCLAAGFLMASYHSLNTWTDWTTGVDKEGGSIEKSYTSGSQAIKNKWATPAEVFVNALFYFLLGTACTYYVAVLSGSGSVWVAFAFAFIFGAFYAPVWKYIGAPELTGAFGFGIAAVWFGAAAAAGDINIMKVVVAGIAVSIPFCISWSVDQMYDAKSDIKRGVHNIGGLLYTTGLPTSIYMTLGVCMTYVFLLFAIVVKALAPMTMLSFAALPMFTICIAKLYSTETKQVESGVWWGLLGIFAFEALVVLGQALGG